MRKLEDVVDALRGFALFGICVVSVPFLGESSDQLFAISSTSVDHTVAWLVEALFQGKFFLLFSFLFGWGAAGALSVPVQGLRYARRLVALAAFGVLHAVFVFHGDILLLYARPGALLWPLRNLSQKALVRVAIAMVPVSFVAMGLLALAIEARTPDVVLAASTGYLGSFGDALQARIAESPQTFVFTVFFNGPLAFGAFALGLAAARDWFFNPGNAAYQHLRRSLSWLIPTSLLLNAVDATAFNGLFAFSMPGQLGGIMALAIAGPLLAACYLALVIEAQNAGWLGEGFHAPGRLSLSAYVAEGIVAGLIFNGYGLAFYGQLGQAGLFAVAVGVFTIVHVLAVAWSRHLNRGPLERVLGWMTGTRQTRAA